MAGANPGIILAIANLLQQGAPQPQKPQQPALPPVQKPNMGAAFRPSTAGAMPQGIDELLKVLADPMLRRRF